MPIPPKVVDLIARFDEHRDAYTSPENNEAQVRDEFIDPMFEALGWDTHNHTILQHRIGAADAGINYLVYELYEPIDEEIAIVEWKVPSGGVNGA